MVDYRRERLPNGLRVIYAHMAGFHSAHAVVALRMGPRFESRAENGLSHFLEHAVFKGTQRYADPDALAREIDAIGADLNGATEPEHTEFLASCHRRHFRRGLELLAELVLRPRFDPVHVETERRVVLEEMAQYHDVFGASLSDLSCELMWPAQGHRFSCLGLEENVRRFTAEELREHYQRHLRAANMVVCVAGDFDRDEVAGALGELFGGLEHGQPSPCPALEDTQRAARVQFRRGHTRRAAVRLAHKAWGYPDPRRYPMLVASEILGGGVTSRLFGRLRERDGLVYDVSSGAAVFSDCGWVEVATTTQPGSVAAAVAGTLEEMRRLADEGVEEGALQTTKERSACQMEILEDSPLDVGEWFAAREILFAPEDLTSPTAEAERLKSVTATDVQAAAQEVFLAARRSLVVVGPVPWAMRRRVRALAER